MSKLPLSRRDLERFLPDRRAIIAFENLFNDTIENTNNVDIMLESVMSALVSAQEAALAIANRIQDIERSPLAQMPQQPDSSTKLDPVPYAIEAIPCTTDSLEPKVYVGSLGLQDAGNANVSGGSVTALLNNSDTNLLTTTTTLSDYAAGNTATMTNAPSAGDPTKWVAIIDNGITRYIPTW